MKANGKAQAGDLDARLRRNRDQAREIYRKCFRLFDELAELESELEANYRAWLLTQEPILSLIFWIERAEERNLRIFYQGEEVAIAQWDFLEPEERTDLLIRFREVNLNTLPAPGAMKAIIRECEASPELSERPFSGEIGERPGERILEIKRRKREIDRELRGYHGRDQELKAEMERLEFDLDLRSLARMKGGSKEESWALALKLSDKYGFGIFFRGSEVIIDPSRDKAIGIPGYFPARAGVLPPKINLPGLLSLVSREVEEARDKGIGIW